MRNLPGTIALDMALYRATLNSSLFEVIINAAYSENVSKVVIDLITIACDANNNIIADLNKEAGDEQSNA
ncbi:MAG: hypothetical protein E7J62_02230 [Serratia marcescens]|uniref:hypothetical protein n=1 Tax=Serratia marcescens TaxID=615 RepID=UPI001C75DD0F|nr:hypothetical protein [Serratia marcescens]MDU7803438.1 hypothetical protein [Serratia marcescens]BCZ43657.1 hypothetical protein SMGES_49830 [Serratia marcescens]HBI6268847.1 hypothetical protein [Serratia marcescens]HBI6949471.1 hypothetical protein [Serratia marcescens]HBI6959713.1 hypothetical protein [Serratia marcescens]